MSRKALIGNLAVANPCNPRDDLEQSVYLITNVTPDITIGICINKPQVDTDLASIAQNLGIPYYRIDPVYHGGDKNTHKIHMIHSLDWQGIGTIPLTKDIGITQDVSVLMALAENKGPYYFKACAGYGQWQTNVLELQISSATGKHLIHKWELVPANIDNVFSLDDRDIWEYCIETNIRNNVEKYFNPSLD